MTALSYTTRALVKARLGIGTADTTDDDLLDDIVEQTNDYIESYTWRPIGPNNGGTATFDGYEDVHDGGRSLYVRQGIRTITSITVAPSTGSSAVTGTVADFVVLPRTQNRKADWPGFEVRVKDSVTGSVSSFGYGYGDIVIVGDFGWAAIPPAIKEIAEVLAVRTWHGRQAGQNDVVGSEANGEPVVSRYLSRKDKMLLASFRPAGGLVAG
jgi:hypothetical protein